MGSCSDFASALGKAGVKGGLRAHVHDVHLYLYRILRKDDGISVAFARAG